MSLMLDTGTPVLKIVDSRGLIVRLQAFHRSTQAVTPAPRVTCQTFDLAGRLVSSRDPRLSVPSQKTVFSLPGQTLYSESVDAGWQLALLGEAGQPVDSWDSRGSVRRISYDALLRPLAVTDQGRVAECFMFGAPDLAEHNQCNRLIRHDDTAGTRLLADYGLFESPLAETRHFTREQAAPDWPESLAERDELLETQGLQSRWGVNALGETITQTDAAGNIHHWGCTVAGQSKMQSVSLAASDQQQMLVDEIGYNAFNQVEQETAGNGVISRYTYDPKDGRLLELRAALAGSAPLQHLKYSYDPVGNILQIEDAAQPIRFFANQRIEPVSTFRYDTLYQLIEATGREVKSSSSHGPALPGLQNLPPDPAQMANYTQRFDYDAAGNLLQMHHVGAQNFTRTMRVAPDSNRSLPEGDVDMDFDEAFDANGNLLQLVRGQALSWNARNQLQQLTTVARAEEPNDGESYIYDGQGQRCRKIANAQARNRTLVDEVRYLPGLEIRTGADGETLHVIIVQAGRSHVRVLHWQAGKPDAIANDQVRYSLSDHLGSSTLELDHQCGLISQESYYPFGGTAWWAARSAVEAKYKTVRYSGKERDASGLYYYGFRYYAPWLLRWISPDPAGDVDGLNLFCMVRNNPVRFADSDGLAPVDDYDLASSPMEQGRIKNAVFKVYPTIANNYRDFTNQTQSTLTTAHDNSLKLKKLTVKQQIKFRKENPVTINTLKTAAAHAGVSTKDGSTFLTGFQNFPGSLSPKDLFPGVVLLNKQPNVIPELKDYVPPPVKELAATQTSLGYFLIGNQNAFIRGVKTSYEQNNTPLHPYMENRIRRHIEEKKFKIPVKAGIPGLHAEVQAVNSLLNQLDDQDQLERLVSETAVFTQRLVAGKGYTLGADFPACFNCSGILPPLLNVLTGRDPLPRDNALRARSASPQMMKHHG